MSEIKPTEGQLTVIDAEGNEKLCQILFTLDSEEFNKKYVVFYPIEAVNDDDSEQISLMAAIYTEGEDGNGELSEIESDEEWKMIEDAVEDYENQMGDECECDDDCECHHEEHHCCCHNHEEE